MHGWKRAAGFAAAMLLALALPARGAEEDEKDRRIEALERSVRELREEVEGLRGGAAPFAPEEVETASALEERIRILEEKAADAEPGGGGRLVFAGYGESHVRIAEGPGEDSLDHHRFVLDISYVFAEWLSLGSELEIEHSAVGEDFGGEIVFEQLFTQAGLGPVGIRVGRFLTPVGIVNQKHEPPSFNGVERPLFDQVVIPTTWSSDGLELFGSPFPFLSFEAGVVAGLDGTGFSATSGIRGGRIAERPSLSSPAVTGRIDVFPFAETAAAGGQHLRFGLSGWYGGTDNGNEGENPGLDGSVGLVSGDFEYTVGPFDFRGVVAYAGIDGAREIGNGVASAIFGWYGEAAFHVFPEAWRTGRLDRSDLVVFVRYEEVDTQFRMPAGIAADPRGDRREITFGLTFFVRPNLVVKLDAQIRDDESDEDLPDVMNFGVGWQF